MTREPIFLAADIREADDVENVLNEAGVDYSLRLEAAPREGGACYQGILYEVASDRAKECRQLILDKGLSRGVMFPGT
ncbi:MAG TPA: hypothetical protein VII12_08185 [Thermoanaerobaculia bacterium]